MNKDVINLVYFGRITESKNIDIIIKTLSFLIKNGFNANLDLIGGCSDEYKQKLEYLMATEDIPQEKIFFHGAQSFDFISNKLRFARYFLFPSKEKKEGHSNSLTEAMAYGVVPIVSKVGFNESICGHPRLVVKEISPECFACRIMDIEQTGEWDYFSHYVYNRVIDHFTEEKALETIKKVIKCLNIN